MNGIQELLAHMAWADATLLAAWAAGPDPEDEELRRRWHHIALVQGAFHTVLTGDVFTHDPNAPTPGFAALRDWTRRNHAAMGELLEGADLDRTARFPWFPDPPCILTVREALTQVALHTQHHRGQVATRLKALGGQPLDVDYILWVWKGRPAADWP